MDPKEIGQAYDQITHLWEREEFDQNNGIQALRRAIAFVKNKGTALDVGCGSTGRFIDYLLSEGFEAEGVDISEEMLRLAKQKHPNVTFYQEDICQWTLPRKYNLIAAWDSLWHVPLNEQQNVLKKLVDALDENGVFIFSCGGTEEPGEHTNKVMGPEIYYSSLGINGLLRLFLDLGCICRHIEYDQYPELHVYFIVQKSVK